MFSSLVPIGKLNKLWLTNRKIDKIRLVFEQKSDFVYNLLERIKLKSFCLDGLLVIYRRTYSRLAIKHTSI